MSKLEKFLRFTTGMDILVGKNIEVTFIKCEGLGARPIAHTCRPVLEIPSTYSNYVEFREDYEYSQSGYMGNGYYLRASSSENVTGSLQLCIQFWMQSLNF